MILINYNSNCRNCFSVSNNVFLMNEDHEFDTSSEYFFTIQFDQFRLDNENTCSMCNSTNLFTSDIRIQDQYLFNPENYIFKENVIYARFIKNGEILSGNFENIYPLDKLFVIDSMLYMVNFINELPENKFCVNNLGELSICLSENNIDYNVEKFSIIGFDKKEIINFLQINIKEFKKQISFEEIIETGREYYSEGKYLIALRYYLMGLEFCNNLEITTKIANTYFRLKMYQEAVLFYTKAIEFDTSNYQNWCNRGVAKKNVNDLDGALFDLTHSININSNDDLSYFNRALVFECLNKYEEAIIDYNNALSTNPNDYFSYYNRGLIYLKNHDYQKSLADLNLVIQIKRNHSNAYYHRGLIYFHLNKNELGLNDIKTSAEIGNKFAIQYLNENNLV
jgi:tetratricopeptide (TPR) repeat protein